MALYSYKGIRSNGRKTSGYTAAHTYREAERNIDHLAIRDYTVKKVVSSLGGLEFILFKDFSTQKLSKKNQAYFFEQMSFLLKSGLTLFQCMDIMSQSSNEQIAKLAVRLKPSISSGLSLDDAMRKTGLFSYDVTAKIEAGRNGGTITEALDSLALKLKEQIEFRSKLVSSLTYPCFMIVMLVAVLVLMLVAIVPSIAETISELGGEMPALTLAIISASNFLVKYGPFVLVGIVLVLGAHLYFLKNIKSYRYLMHSLIYKLPLIGKLTMKIHIQSLAGTMSQLLSSGVTTAAALNICTKTTSNLKLQDMINRTYLKVSKEGYDLFAAIASTKFFPISFTQMVMVGTKSGNIDGVLDSIADQYAKEVQESLKRMSSLVEPIAIMATALVGGICVIALYLPMFNVFQSM